MAAPSRTSWKGFLKLSLISVPVKAFTANETSGEVHLNQLHKDCNSRVKYMKVCPEHGELKSEAIVSGYEHGKDQYVVVDPDELDKLRTKTDRAVSIDGFVPMDAVDGMYFAGKAHYLLPDGIAGSRPYALLRDGMQQNGVCAIAQVVMTGREQLVLLRPHGKLLVMTGLHYPARVRKAKDFEGEVEDIKFKPEEVALTNTLITASKLATFDLDSYQDQYVTKLKKLIALKVDGKEVVQAPDHEEPKILNLMDALKKSVAEAQARMAGGEAPADEAAAAKLAPSSGKKKGPRKVEGWERERQGMATPTLPPHVEPMLARIGSPFDSPDHLFEIKWDGVRAVAYVQGGAHRLHGRRRRDLATRYPELAFLASLPDGCILDGELVVLRPDGTPDFRAMIGRENATAARVAIAAAAHPVVYVVFDLLYEHGESLLAVPLRERRERLERLVAMAGNDRLRPSDGVVGAGNALFAAVRERGLEGIVGKRLDSPYLPGERTDAWLKMKLVQQIHCLVLGYEPDGASDFKSLIVATDVDGELRCVGKVGSGIGEAERVELRALLFGRRTARPLVDPGIKGCWIEPGLYCTVNFLEWTANGSLRAPVFVGLVRGGGK